MENEDKKTGRREFLKDICKEGCKIAATSTLFLGILPIRLPRAMASTSETPETQASTSEGQHEDEKKYDWEDHLYSYLIDTRKCIGCGMCVKACRLENKVPEGFYRTWVERYEIAERGEVHIDSPKGGQEGFEPIDPGFRTTKGFFVPKMCNHCSNTPCTQVCPVGASYTTKEGVVMVDPKHCIGCGYCVQACPYASRYIDPETHTADKCTWCYHRITKGLKPACVQACPSGARKFGDMKKEDDEVRKILATERVGVLQPEKLTKPSCFYLGLDREIR